MNKYFETVRGIIARFFLKEPESLTVETDMVNDLGARSVVIMQIMSAIEDEYDITLNFMQFKRQKTIGEIVAYVQETDEE